MKRASTNVASPRGSRTTERTCDVDEPSQTGHAQPVDLLFMTPIRENADSDAAIAQLESPPSSLPVGDQPFHTCRIPIDFARDGYGTAAFCEPIHPIKP